ncbi:MAG: nucleotidyltransferase domain-containing protein [Candidatus Diapherotrites archaeon]
MVQKFDFLGANSLRVVEKLSSRPYYVRELAEELNMAPSTILSIAKSLIREGVIFSKREKNRLTLCLSFDSVLARRIVSFSITNKILHLAAFKKLIELKPRGAYLFGSSIEGNFSEKSDVDLCIYFEKIFDLLKVNSIKMDVEKALGREVQLIILTPKKIEEMRKSNSNILKEIIYSSIVLYGERLERT